MSEGYFPCDNSAARESGELAAKHNALLSRLPKVPITPSPAMATELYELLDTIHNEMCVNGYGSDDPARVPKVYRAQAKYERRMKLKVEDVLRRARG